jgi:hypothetical protein
MALCNRKVFFKFTVADQRKRKKRDDSTLKNVFLLTWKSNPQMTEREIVTNEKTSFAAFSPPPLLECPHFWINVKHSQLNINF